MYNLQVAQGVPQQAATAAPTQDNISNSAKAPSFKGPLHPKKIAIGILAVVVVIVLIGIWFIRGPSIMKSSVTTTVTYTTIPITNITKISSLDSCTNITQSGVYNITSSIKTGIQKGACIAIQTSNVKLYCSGKSIVGSGPFDAVAPFSYGIYTKGQSNITITGCSIYNFSYGIGAYSSANLNITANNATSNYMSNIYINNTSSSRIYKNTLAKALSWQGSLYIGGDSTFDQVYNNNIGYNQLYGINVSASGNTYLNNTVNTSSEYGFYCNVKNSYTSASSASNNTCFNNDGCGFLTCGGTNIPANISQVKLSSEVSGCGSITGPGIYSLSGPIDMGAFINVYNPATLQSMIPCIRIYSAGVTLNCKGNLIYNATYPIAIYNSDSVLVENCRISGAKGTGIGLYGSINSTLQNVTVQGSGYGIALSDSYSNNVSDSSINANKYGILLNNSQSNNLLDLNSSNNQYGIYLEGKSTGNNFYNIRAYNNTEVDLFAASNISQQKSNYVSGMACGTSNVKWADCRALLVGNTSYIPVTGCEVINTPGTYQLQGSLLHSYDNCITISSNDVQFDCQGDYIDTVQSNSRGFALLVENSSDVLVNNCQFDNFEGGVNVYKSDKVTISNTSVEGSQVGIVLNQSDHGIVENNYINTTTQSGIELIGSNNDKVKYNTISYGIGSTAGIVLNNSIKNTVINNTVSQLSYGYRLVGLSTGNLFSNNTASASGIDDFFCSQQNSNLSAESGGVNFGTSKAGCRWMAAVQQIYQAPSCAATSSSDTFSLASDYVYPYSSTCYTLLNNASTVNCNYHTIIATNGGIFAKAQGSQGSIIENCYLKGFNTSLEVLNGSANVYNNTILNGPQGVGLYGLNFDHGAIIENNVSGGKFAFELYNASNVNIKDNQVYGSNTAYYLVNSQGVQLQNDNAAQNTQYGVVLNSSIYGTLGGSILASSISGLSCIGSAIDTDLGGNSCSVNNGCSWIKSSSGTC